MEQENSNDVRPAEQIAPHTAPEPAAPAGCPEEYITVKVPKGKIKKFVKAALIVIFIMSLWMNLVFMHAIMRGRHGMQNHMGFQRTAQFQIDRGGGIDEMPGFNNGGGKAFYGSGHNAGGGNSYNSGNSYYWNGDGQNGNYKGNYRLPSR